MALPRVRFTVRRMMAVVGGVAILIGGGLQAVRLNRASDLYARKAAGFRADEARSRAQALWARRLADESWDAARDPRREPLAASSARLAKSFDQAAQSAWNDANRAALLAEKYEHAARHPWEPVVADPVPLPPSTRRLVTPEM